MVVWPKRSRTIFTLPKTEKPYYILTNLEELAQGLVARGYDNVIYSDAGQQKNSRADQDLVDQLAASDSKLLNLWYVDKNGEEAGAEWEGMPEGIFAWILCSAFRRKNRDCYRELMSVTAVNIHCSDRDAFTAHFLTEKEPEKYAEDKGWINRRA